MSETCPAQQHGPGALPRQERKENSGPKLKLSCRQVEMVSDIENIRGTSGTWYIYHYIKVSIIMFVDNPVITALEAPP